MALCWGLRRVTNECENPMICWHFPRQNGTLVRNGLEAQMSGLSGDVKTPEYQDWIWNYDGRPLEDMQPGEARFVCWKAGNEKGLEDTRKLVLRIQNAELGARALRLKAEQDRDQAESDKQWAIQRAMAALVYPAIGNTEGQVFKLALEWQADSKRLRAAIDKLMSDGGWSSLEASTQRAIEEAVAA